MTSDRERILAAQAVRAFAYGMGAVVLGTSLAARGLDDDSCWRPARVRARRDDPGLGARRQPR